MRGHSESARIAATGKAKTKPLSFLLVFMVFVFSFSMVSHAATIKFKAKVPRIRYLVGESSQIVFKNTKRITYKFRSSHKKVFAVSKKGIIKAKKAGKTKISIKYKGKTYSCTLTVKKKGKLIKGKYLKLYNKYKAMKKYARTKVTASNFSKIKKAFTAYETLLRKYCKDFEPGSGLVTIGKKKKILYVDFEYLTVASNLSEFAWSALENSLVITDVKVNSARKLTATLKKPVTALQSDIFSFCGNTHYEANEFQFYGWDGLKRETYPLTIDLVCNIKKGASKLVFTPSAENADSLKDAMMLVVFHEYGAFTLDNEEEDFYFFRPAE